MQRGYRLNAARAYANYYADTRNTANFIFGLGQNPDRTEALVRPDRQGRRASRIVANADQIDYGSFVPLEGRAKVQNQVRRNVKGLGNQAMDLGQAGLQRVGQGAGYVDNLAQGLGRNLSGGRMTNALGRRGLGYGAAGLGAAGALAAGTAGYRMLRGRPEEEQY